jgi:hypothetical protein
MLAFNNVLSSQRITIERAFGILVRRWGILWRPIAYSLYRVARIARVCAMLHNICVDRWLLKHPRPYVNDKRSWPDVPDQIGVEDPMPEDEEILRRMHNKYTHARSASAISSVREHLTEEIFRAGICTNTHTEFHSMTD